MSLESQIAVDIVIKVKTGDFLDSRDFFLMLEFPFEISFL